MASDKRPVYLLVPVPAPRATLEATMTGDLVVELCEHCYGLVLAGQHDAHMRTVSHRHTPEG